jgi:crossover junction endodeoxyribonuclease RusA
MACWQLPYDGPLRIVVVYYHERQSVLIDHDNLIKPIQDALAGLVYQNDRQITDALTRKTNIDGRFRVRHLSKLYAEAFQRGREFIYVRIEEAPSHEELL